MKTVYITVILVSVLFLISPLQAAENQPTPENNAQEETVAKNVIGVGAKVGFTIPQINSEFDTSFSTHLELTYLMPFWGSRFGIVTALGYSQPGASGSGIDERLPEGSYSWEISQKQLLWDLGVTLRVMSWETDWNVAFSTGSRMMFVSTVTNGTSGGESFGEHDEQGRLYGFFLSALAEYRLGPGSLFGELNYCFTLQDLRTTGDLSFSEIKIMAGYRFDFAF